jgi:hypothetical protein
MNDEQIANEESFNADINSDVAPEDTAALPKPKREYASKIILAAGVGAVLWGLIAPLGSGWGLWDWKAGLGGIKWSFFLGLGAMLIGIINIWRVKRKGLPWRPLLWLGTLTGAAYSIWIISLLIKAFGVPAIHDISTDLADPPQFAVLAERADNFDDIPGADDKSMSGLNPQQRWATLHQKAYGDIRTVRINMPMDQVIAKASRLAKDRGWEIAADMPAEGRLEATATTAMFRFKDDIVLRVRPAENRTSSIVDMRSVSRVGQSDIGVNAERVREFLADLSGTVTAVR